MISKREKNFSKTVTLENYKIGDVKVNVKAKKSFLRKAIYNVKLYDSFSNEESEYKGKLVPTIEKLLDDNKFSTAITLLIFGEKVVRDSALDKNIKFKIADTIGFHKYYLYSNKINNSLFIK